MTKAYTIQTLEKYFDNCIISSREEKLMDMVAELESASNQRQNKNASAAEIKAFVESVRAPKPEPEKYVSIWDDEDDDMDGYAFIDYDEFPSYTAPKPLCPKHDNKTREEMNDFIVLRMLNKRNRIKQAFAHAHKQRLK